MDQPICQIWFDTVFVPTVRMHTRQPVLLLLDNAPGHFERFEKDGFCVELSPPNCTSWKQPCDQGINNALETRYKFLYLCDVLSFYKLKEEKNGFKRTRGKNYKKDQLVLDLEILPIFLMQQNM
jgi:DDE superfamily endonuclease